MFPAIIFGKKSNTSADLFPDMVCYLLDCGKNLHFDHMTTQLMIALVVEDIIRLVLAMKRFLAEMHEVG